MSLKVGGKKTALEAAIERRGRIELDPRRLVVALLIGVAAALAAACLWQASAVRHDAVVSNQVSVTRDWAAGETKKVLAALDARVREGLDDEDIRALLAKGDDESRALAAARIKQRLPEIVEVELYPPDLREVMYSDLQKFGYVRADVLSDARPRAGVSRVQAQRDNSGTWRLAMARAVAQGDQVLAYAYLLMPLDRLTQVLSQGETGGGYLDLRQIMVRGYGVPLYLFPGASGSPASEDVVAEIPDSRLAIGGRGTQSFRIGSVISLVDSTNVPLLTVFGVSCSGSPGGCSTCCARCLASARGAPSRWSGCRCPIICRSPAWARWCRAIRGPRRRRRRSRGPGPCPWRPRSSAASSAPTTSAAWSASRSMPTSRA